MVLLQDGLAVASGMELRAVGDADLRLGPFPGHMTELRCWDAAKLATEAWRPWVFGRFRLWKQGISAF